MIQLQQWVRGLLLQEDINFLLTNRIPRRLATRVMGWISKIENPVISFLGIRIWRFFSDLDLSEAESESFKSLHACFTRKLKPGSRPIDHQRDHLLSPCDAIVGAMGIIRDTTLLQAKGFPYTLESLANDTSLAQRYRHGSYVTLRLTSSMYHRFHAPADGHITEVTYLSGDTWNVNPIALRRVEQLFCKNERALIRLDINGEDQHITLIAVAAILVASIQLHGINVRLNEFYQGPVHIPCDLPVKRGQELGYFEHGSTMLLLAPPGFTLLDHLVEGQKIRMGEALMKIPSSDFKTLELAI